MTVSTGEAYENAHAVIKQDPRHDGPYLDDVNAAREAAYRDVRTASHKRTDEALKEYDGLDELDRQRRVDEYNKKAEEEAHSQDAYDEAVENAKKDQVPLSVAQDHKLLQEWNNNEDTTRGDDAADSSDENKPPFLTDEETDETGDGNVNPDSNTPDTSASTDFTPQPVANESDVNDGDEHRE